MQSSQPADTVRVRDRERAIGNERLAHKTCNLRRRPPPLTKNETSVEGRTHPQMYENMIQPGNAHPDTQADETKERIRAWKIGSCRSVSGS
mmetsp:Transcript_16323/g.33158  ORF Transcript_16323/g.33158 Transcript_16323/m.33158 type:complete len:91 (-) Transcript_16323:1326-1598(-)